MTVLVVLAVSLAKLVILYRSFGNISASRKIVAEMAD